MRRRNRYLITPIPTPIFGNLKMRNGQRFTALPANEFGFPMCELPNGNLSRDVPVSWGTPMAVDVNINCPVGTRFLGVFHTHPGGIAFPSRQDQIAAVQSGSEIMCIQNDTELNCFRIRAVAGNRYARAA